MVFMLARTIVKTGTTCFTFAPGKEMFKVGCFDVNAENLQHIFQVRSADVSRGVDIFRF